MFEAVVKIYAGLLLVAIGSHVFCFILSCIGSKVLIFPGLLLIQSKTLCFFVLFLRFQSDLLVLFRFRFGAVTIGDFVLHGNKLCAFLFHSTIYKQKLVHKLCISFGLSFTLKMLDFILSLHSRTGLWKLGFYLF